MKNYTYLEAGIMDSDNGSCLMEEITENTDIDEMVFDAIKVDVIGFGALNVDKLYKVKNIAGVDGESFIKSEDVSPGGSAANTIIGLSKARMLHFIHRQDSR